MSVAILYYKVSQERISSGQQSGQIADWLKQLPAKKQQQVSRLRQPRDQLLSLAGLQLLKHGISELTGQAFDLNQLQFPEKAKPYYDGDIDFNISHSGDIACCILSDTAKVGIDIELHREVNAATMKKFLNKTNPNENNHDKLKQKKHFFDLWTKNEAVIKAANHGSIFNMQEIQHQQNGSYYQDKFWYHYPVEILCDDDNNEYTCHIASSEKLDNKTDQLLKARQIHFKGD